LAAHLAVHIHGATRRCLLVDDDPQGSLTLWNELRAEYALPLKIVKRGIGDIVKKAKKNEVEWVLLDTPSNGSASVVEAIDAATFVIIPCRPGLFDIDAVQQTIALAEQARTPYAIILNGARDCRLFSSRRDPNAMVSKRRPLQRRANVWRG
jgi:chromosome partitioning protein